MSIVRKATPERLSIFSDGVFAVLITVLVLELHAPDEASFEALLSHWPAFVSYAMSYLFIAIVWLNHHYLMRYARQATPRLLWFNFAHLFSMSLVPLSTAWMAASRLSPQPVAFYGGVFFLVNATYVALIWELCDQVGIPSAVRKIMRMRAIVTLCIFAIGTMTALKFPLVSIGMYLCCLIVYLRPEPPFAADLKPVRKRK